jgi:ubiquinone/menaquinone biosynthesis C-methylase UbiE
MTAALNPFDDPQLAARYEGWYAGPGLRADRLEKSLLHELMSDFPLARTGLDVGCGTGHFTRWLEDQGLTVAGLDLSRPMLDEAERLGSKTLVEGDAMELPFPDGEFDLVALITSLEFLAAPERALTEAVRVARMGLLLGVLNRHSLLAARHRISGREPWQAARFFTVTELVRLVKRAGGPRLQSLRWRTTLWPLPRIGSLPLPWGGFIGMSVQLRAS